MTIGIDASNLRNGGGITHLLELLRVATPDQFDIDRVVVWGGRRVLEALAPRPWLEVVHEPMLDGPLLSRLVWREHRLKTLARKTCDLVFSPGGSTPLRGLPHVVMCRNMLPFEPAELQRYAGHLQHIRLKLLRWSQSNSFRTADGVIFLTQFARFSVLRQLGSICGASAVVPHGVDARFRCAPRVQEPIDRYSATRPFELLYVSTIDLYKHQDTVARAVIRAHRHGYPVRLSLVGGSYPPAERSLKRLLKRLDPGGEVVQVRGPAPFSGLQSLYHRADAFIFASSCENLPNILIEAMASGLPILCSNRGPMPDVLGEAGLYFDPENCGELTAALEQVLADPELRGRCSWAAYNRASRYSWEECARATFSFCRDVASRRSVTRHAVRAGSSSTR